VRFSKAEVTKKKWGKWKYFEFEIGGGKSETFTEQETKAAILPTPEEPEKTRRIHKTKRDLLFNYGP